MELGRKGMRGHAANTLQHTSQNSCNVSSQLNQLDWTASNKALKLESFHNSVILSLFILGATYMEA